MEDLLKTVTAFISQHGAWAAPAVGLLAFGESLAFLGLFIPATPLLIVIGGLIASHLLSGWPILGCAIIGTVMGDWISYRVGQHLGHKIFYRWPLSRHQRSVAHARLFFGRHGFLSVFLGRFLGPLRVTIPLVAGVMRMQRRTFLIADTTSAVLWVSALLAIGYITAPTVATVALDARGIAIAGTAALILLALSIGMAAHRFGTDQARWRPKRILKSGT